MCWMTWRSMFGRPSTMGVPLTMEEEAECEETSKANIVTKGACLARMRARYAEIQTASRVTCIVFGR